MTIYVDPIQYHKTGPWCHMATDNLDDLSELHQMAQQIGLLRSWFQDDPLHPHYDLRPSARKQAIKIGAIPVSKFEFVKKCSRYIRLHVLKER